MILTKLSAQCLILEKINDFESEKMHLSIRHSSMPLFTPAVRSIVLPIDRNIFVYCDKSLLSYAVNLGKKLVRWDKVNTYFKPIYDNGEDPVDRALKFQYEFLSLTVASREYDPEIDCMIEDESKEHLPFRELFLYPVLWSRNK